MSAGLTCGQIEQVMRKKGYAFFDTGDFNLNIIGVRNGRLATNKFDDRLYILYMEGGVWKQYEAPFTTKPGKGPMLNPANPKGVAILVPGQYRGAYKIGKHKGLHDALVQVRPVTVYRDLTRDMELSYVNPETGYFGINIHWSSTTHDSVQVDNWSEGCQVGTGAENYKQFIALLQKSCRLFGDVFSYTLLEAEDFVGV